MSGEEPRPEPPRVGVIWAEAADGVIGAGGGMPWHLPEDLAHFRAVTDGGPVVMGRRTWDSLPERFRPLPGRVNLVVTADPEWSAEGAVRAASLDEAIDRARTSLAAADGTVWVIGGASVYAQALPVASVVERTVIDAEFAGDAFAPRLAGDEWMLVAADPPAGAHRSRTGLGYRFERYERPRADVEGPGAIA